MGTNLLSDTAIRNARPRAKEFELSDGGGLSLRIRADGRRAWIFRYTSPSTGTRGRLYMGAYPTLSLKAARELRAKRAELIAKGIDPKNATALLDEVGDEIPATVSQLFTAWFEKEVMVNRTSEEDRRAIRGRFTKYVAPAMSDVALQDVRRGHAMKPIDTARKFRYMRTANLLLVEMRQMFTFAVVREWMTADPTAAIKRRDAGGEDGESDRALEADEIVMLRDILGRPPAQRAPYYVATRRVLPVRTELMMWWTLATTARALEVASIKRGAVNVDAREWKIPAEVSKNKKPHVVHLSDFALAVWERIEQLPGAGTYVFSGRDGAGHVSEKEVTRRLTDRQSRPKPVAGRKNTTDLDLPGGRWTQHDLRRTGATIMGELDIPSDVIDRCLNHTEPNKVKRTYQRQVMMRQRREAFDALGDYLVELLGDPACWLPAPRLS